MRVIFYFIIMAAIEVGITGQSVKTEDFDKQPIVLASTNHTAKIKADTTIKSCTDCHTEQMKHKVKHVAAILDCKNCHEPILENHPSSSTGFKLKAPVPELCFNCHAHIPKGKHVHPPVALGKCLDCHDPHSSPNKRLWLEPTSGALCLKCHKDHLKLDEKNMLHKPVENMECHLCHNPHSTNTQKFLKADVPKLCLKCHKDKRKLMKMDHVHPPFKADCRICHEPHGSKEPNLRRTEIIPLCTMCHPQIGMQLKKSPVLHKAVFIDKNCANCHSPHASQHDKQLRFQIVDMCLKCHDKPISGENREIPSIGDMISEDNHVHGAIEKFGCTACHNPHAASKNRLLKEEFSVNEYVPAKIENFALCFKCHNPELFEKQLTKTATNFRKGDKNLHFVHVNRGEKGRNCKLCHNIHGSKNDHMINEKLKFGKWMMPLNYEHNENGGSCLPGCHERRSYSRSQISELNN